jgi:hypothetical protein
MTLNPTDRTTGPERRETLSQVTTPVRRVIVAP